jgi:hypothetical protein
MMERDKSREARMDRMASMAAFTKVVGTQRAKCRALRQPVTKQIQELKT